MRIKVVAIIVAGSASLLMAQDAQRPRKVRENAAPPANTTPRSPSSVIETTARISIRFIELQLDANGKGSLHIDCQTNGEARLWSKLRNRQLDGLKFRRQVPRGRYIADFLCDEANARRAAEAGRRQVEAARRLMADESWAMLAASVRTVAQLRLDHPYLSLQELAARARPPLTKSSLNHRLRRMVALSEERAVEK